MLFIRANNSAYLFIYECKTYKIFPLREGAIRSDTLSASPEGLARSNDIHYTYNIIYENMFDHIFIYLLQGVLIEGGAGGSVSNTT